MTNVSNVAKFMGGPSVVGTPRSEFDFIAIIRLGLPSDVIKSIVKSSSITEDVICKALRIARRTVARRQSNGERLKATESERIYRLSRVLVSAREVLGDKSKAKEWLLTHNSALNGQRPIDLLDTGIGFSDCMDVLQRIEFGVYS